MVILRDNCVKTRKDNTCFCCDRKFEKGSLMWSQVNIYNGCINSSYTCISCKELIREFPHIFMDDGVYYQSDIALYIKERDLNESPEQLLLNLKTEMKR